MAWKDKRDAFQKRFDDLSQRDINGLLQNLNKNMGAFIGKGGVSMNATSNPEYNAIQTTMNQITEIKNGYSTLYDDIVKYLSKETQDNDLSGLLTENGELQKQIHRLTKIEDEMKVDVESAIARDELLRSRNTESTPHRLFLLGRPVRRGILPYLWVLSVLFIGVGLLICKQMFPFDLSTTGSYATSVPFLFMMQEFLSSRSVLLSLLVAALITILFLSLKVAGVFGK